MPDAAFWQAGIIGFSRMVDGPFYRTVLVLSPYPEAIIAAVESTGDRAMPGDLRDAGRYRYDWIVSYGFRQMIPPAILQAYPDRVVNLHISFLPWNRGADPNYWSWVDGTPKGVTLHYVDDGMDTGDIIAQGRLPDVAPPGATLASTYADLRRAADDLFASVWPDLRNGRAPRTKQPEGGSIHRKADLPHLDAGWYTCVAEIAPKA